MEMFAIVLNNTMLQASNIISILNKSFLQYAQTIITNCINESQDDIDKSKCIINLFPIRQSTLKTTLTDIIDICFIEFYCN